MSFHLLAAWRNLAEHILQNIHVNDNDPSTHTLHIAIALTIKDKAKGRCSKLIG